MIMTYKALETVIIEDIFGRDNLYLKGHTYDLTYSDWNIVQSNGRSIQGFSTIYLLSMEYISKYFQYEETVLQRGGKGNSVIKIKEVRNIE
jgi:hypothetical protein